MVRVWRLWGCFFLLLFPPLTIKPMQLKKSASVVHCLRDWPKAVVRISCEDWPEKSQMIGPCEPPFLGSEIYGHIQKNYKVTLYASHPDRCVSFDPGGIIGDQRGSCTFDISILLQDAIRACMANNSHCISGEANEGMLGHCTLIEMLVRLALKLGLPHVPTFFIYPGDNCESFDSMCEDVIKEVRIPASFLQKYSDDALAYILVIILRAIRQFYFGDITGNNKEVEADIISILTNGNPYAAVYLRRYSQLPFPELTRSNVDELFGGDKLPQARIVFVLTMYEYYKMARELLFLAEED